MTEYHYLIQNVYFTNSESKSIYEMYVTLSTNKTRKKFYLEYRIDTDKSSQKMVFDDITSAVQFYNIIVSRAINEYDCAIAMINHMNF